MSEVETAQIRTNFKHNIMLLKMMRKRKMKGKELAKATGMHKCSISRIICGRANPKDSTVLMLCAALTCEPEEIGL